MLIRKVSFIRTAFIHFCAYFYICLYNVAYRNIEFFGALFWIFCWLFYQSNVCDRFLFFANSNWLRFTIITDGNALMKLVDLNEWNAS